MSFNSRGTSMTGDYSSLLSRMQGEGVLLLDGGVGTELERRGLTMDAAAWCGITTERQEEVLKAVHHDYIQAGAEIITANTFASSRLMLEKAGHGASVSKINRLAVQIAREIRGQSNRKGIVVAGSLSHMLPIRRGAKFAPEEDAPALEKIATAFNEQANILSDSGCELIILEMMYKPSRVRLALDSAINTGLPIWAGLSAREGADGRLLSYDLENELEFRTLVQEVINDRVDAIGIMHTSPHLIGGALEVIAEQWDGPRFAYPDSGHFQPPNWKFENVITPSDLRQYAEGWVKQGVGAVGGCCGLSPLHIAALEPLKR